MKTILARIIVSAFVFAEVPLFLSIALPPAPIIDTFWQAIIVLVIGGVILAALIGFARITIREFQKLHRLITNGIETKVDNLSVKLEKYVLKQDEQRRAKDKFHE